MRVPANGFLLVLILIAIGCDSGKPVGRDKASSLPEPVTAPQALKGGGDLQPAPPASRGKLPQVPHMAVTQRGGGGGGGRSSVSNRGSTTDDASALSLAAMGSVYAATVAQDRKIIRDAELTLETESPTEGLRKITDAAESHGGFVVTSEFKQNPVAAGVKPSQSVTVVARVPATQFVSALDQIRSSGERLVQEKVSGQDVSEEYLDLEARLRTKKALEAQFLQIMRQARKVEDALEVQRELADVRTEIERFEGRRRFLENQAALSTITTTLQMPQPMVAATTSGFGASVKRAAGDAVDSAASIVLFIIQAVILLVPIGLFFGLPAWLVVRVLRRRILLRKPEPSPIP